MLDLNFTLEDAYETSMSATATQGRVTEIDLQEADIVSASVAEQPAYGHAVINPDNKLALVLSGTVSTSDLTIPVQITHSDETVETKTVNVTVETGLQNKGWGPGDHYMLETDANTRTVIEPGRVHRKVYVSGSVDAWSRQDIATAESVSLGTISGNWLRDHPFYGGSPEEPLDDDAANYLFASITSGNKPASTWYLFERGYTYEHFFETGPHFVDRMYGESPLHPLVFTSYGTGTKPLLMVMIGPNQGFHETAFIDVDLGSATEGGIAGKDNHENLLLENVFIDNGTATFRDGFAATFRHCGFDNHHKLVSDNPTPGTWHQSWDKTSAWYAVDTDGVLIEYCFGDQNGWEDGFVYNQSTDYPQSPSAKSQQYYIQGDCGDVTFRRNFASRSAGCNIQLRGGGFMQESALLASNNGNNVGWGHFSDAEGNYAMLDNVIQSGALWEEAVDTFGWFGAGYYLACQNSTFKDLIVCHAWNPADPADKARMEPLIPSNSWTNGLVYINDNFHGVDTYYEPAYDDAIIYNWGVGCSPAIVPTPNFNIDGLDTEVLDTLTHQNWLDGRLSTTGSTTADVAQYFRDIMLAEESIWPELLNYLNFVLTGFGRDGISTRSTPTTLNFVPKAIFDGVRWDNPNNWDSEDIPINGDSLNLRGNKTRYGGTGSLSLAALTFGKGGSLATTCGRLTVTGTIATAAGGNTVTITRAGQVWITDYAGANALAVNISSGRFAVLGDVTGRIDITVSGKAEVLLATAGGADYAVSNLTITGSTAWVGFDGENADAVSATMGAGSVLTFVPDASGFSKVQDFTSGAFATPSVTSAVVIDGTLHLDLTTMPVNGTYTLIDVGAVSGSFDTVTATGNGSKALTIARTGTTVTVQIANGAGTITNDT